MLKTIVVATAEPDDMDVAVEDIVSQIDTSELLKNTVAVIASYPDFISSGIVGELSARLPFDIVGATTNAAFVDDSMESSRLVLTVFTSDDVSFSIALSEAIEGEEEAVIADTYTKAAAASGRPGENPTLMMSFAPLLNNVGGDYFVNTLSAVSGGVPNFGTITIDDTFNYADVNTLYLGEAYKDRLAVLLFYGDMDIHFYRAAIAADKIYRDEADVTASEGNQLQTINGVSVESYLLSLGLEKNEDGQIEGVNSYPFIVKYTDDSEPVVRILFATTPEGYAVCGGDIPVGSKISVGYIDDSGVLNTTGNTLKEIISGTKTRFVMMYSCIGRYFALGVDPNREANKIHTMLSEAGIAYSLAYSGGEICPLNEGQDNAIVNRFHNDTFIAVTIG